MPDVGAEAFPHQQRAGLNVRAYRVPKASGIKNLTLVDEVCREPGPREVRVRMRATALNYKDLVMIDDRMGRADAAPNIIPLSDGAGDVVAAGPEVTRFAVGDRVAGTFFQGWFGGGLQPAHFATMLGGRIDGVLTQERVFDQEGLVAIPPHLSFEEAATLPCAAVTAWAALYEGRRPLNSGDTVLALGTGGVAVFALQFALAAGARVIASTSSDAKLKRLEALGITNVINHTRHPDWEAEVLRLTKGVGVDHVVETSGPGTFAKSVACTRLGGMVHLIGALSQGTIDPMILMLGAINVQGVLTGSREMFETMNRTIDAHKIHPVIDRVFGFDEAKSAFAYLEERRHVGKVVIRID